MLERIHILRRQLLYKNTFGMRGNKWDSPLHTGNQWENDEVAERFA